MTQTPAPEISYQPSRLSLAGDRASTIGIRIVLVLSVMFLVAPLIAVIGTAFNRPPTILFPPKTITLEAFRLIPPVWYDSFFLSLQLAALASTISCLLVVPAALGIARGVIPGRATVETLFRSPLQVPQVVLAVGIYQFYVMMQATLGMDALGGLGGLVIAHCILVAPYMFGTILGRIEGLNPSIEEASEGLGASGLRTFFLVTLPLLRPAVLASLIIAFIVSFDNVTLSLFLSGDGGTSTLPVTLFSAVEIAVSPVVFAAAALTILLSLFAGLLLERWVGLRNVVTR
jgi:putative spermidine/putrescine transport system permease protein